MKILFAIWTLMLAFDVRADGRFEINQLCAATGCFVGDSPGWPVEITESGSYRLTSNLIVASLSGLIDGVRISSSNVTLDLGGFTIRGPVICVADTPTCFSGNSRYGIEAVPQPGDLLRNIKIFSGVVRGFDLDCIKLPVRNFELIDLRVSDCGNSGIRTTKSGRLDRVNVSQNGGGGATVTSAARVSNSTFVNNGASGVISGICESNHFSGNGDAFNTPEQACTLLLANNSCNAGQCP